MGVLLRPTQFQYFPNTFIASCSFIGRLLHPHSMRRAFRPRSRFKPHPAGPVTGCSHLFAPLVRKLLVVHAEPPCCHRSA